jgi:hypothetical protein
MRNKSEGYGLDVSGRKEIQRALNFIEVDSKTIFLWCTDHKTKVLLITIR